VSEVYEERQVVGIDVHRRRSVLVRMTETGDRLETVRIVNDPQRLAAVMARAGEAPEVVLEATYGWYWAADTLAELGASVHLAHPLGVKAFSYRRVKNDERDAADLADLLRMGRLPEAWIAPPATRELRELVRHRAKLVGLRTSVKCQVHAVIAAAGVPVSMSDLFGLDGHELLRTVNLPSASRARIDSCRRMISALDWEVELFTNLLAGRLRTEPGYRAIQTIPGVGPTLAAVFVAEIGDVTRFERPGAAGVVGGAHPPPPRVRHHRAPWTDHQAGLAAGALGRGRGRPARRQDRTPRAAQGTDRCPPRAQHRHPRRRPQADRPGVLRAA
jgi:transposase